ncbi:hypothetical protein C1T17_19250 [Sphingobium sp. SCG-1]|uniref:hypothetical protein n=1 Tax=Sphingobium sp. SCG-1 TaxID=2072936 RepID=UPI000CD6804D|nr:hypothetical protein [Sphingobium sp. SCG-1]AUW59895.1 hypothetical protein C1T17_19250 [Sphingobium sp. SCG-1]
MTASLSALVKDELLQPADPRAMAMAAALATVYPGAARAVLFYGSCLREDNLDGLMLDFYLIVSDYRAAYGKSWLARANRLIPPNVFPFEHDGLIAKYAVLSEADFHRLCGPEADNVSVWARFAQPARLLWVADDVASARAVIAVSRATTTLLDMAAPAAQAAEQSEPLDLWRTGFALTYKAELRAERSNRSGSILDSDPERYGRFAAAHKLRATPYTEAEIAANARKWRKLQRHGKRLTVARLAKASFTFAGGIDYLAWKINRHAGANIQIKPWHRRFPLLGAVTLLPRLFRSGAIR